VIEQEVQVEVLAIDHDPLLAGDEREAGPELKEESLHLPEDGRLEVLLAVRVRQAQEVEEVRIAEDQVRRELVLRSQPGQFPLGELGGLPRQCRSFEEHPVDLGPERADAPPLDPAHLGVEVAPEPVLEREDLDEVAPAQFSRQRRDNLPVRVELSELDHPSQALLGEASPVIGGQLSRHRRDDLLPVAGPLMAEGVRQDPLPDLPVEEYLGRIDGSGDSNAGRLN